MNRLLPFLAWRHSSPSPLKALEMGFYDSTSAPGAALADAAGGAGSPETSFASWHDSSHDLLNGLAVTEHGGLDALPPEHRPQ